MKGDAQTVRPGPEINKRTSFYRVVHCADTCVVCYQVSNKHPVCCVCPLLAAARHKKGKHFKLRRHEETLLVGPARAGHG